VANTYDELLSGPRDQKVYMPDEAVGRLQELAGTKLNKELVGLFLQVVPVYPMGMEVVVLDGACSGYRGIVSQVNPLELDMPIVTLIRDDTGAPIDPIEMDTGLECVPIRCLGF
jgi:HD-GYP domain-containing protein (c-di-GMP phosphodiesterase class II)